MKTSPYAKLITAYPKLFDHENKQGPQMLFAMFGVECGDGWFNLIDTLCGCINDEIVHNVMKDEKIEIAVLQVKEKFGSLRFYYSGGNDRIEAMVILAENLSHRICEVCGAPGEIDYDASWQRCRCKKHKPKD